MAQWDRVNLEVLILHDQGMPVPNDMNEVQWESQSSTRKFQLKIYNFLNSCRSVNIKGILSLVKAVGCNQADKAVVMIAMQMANEDVFYPPSANLIAM